MTRKAISIKEFLELPEELQFEVLHKHGVYVGKRKLDGQFLILYQLHDFYVELFYKQYRKTLDKLITSDTTDILQPYLEQICIRDLSRKEN